MTLPPGLGSFRSGNRKKLTWTPPTHYEQWATQTINNTTAQSDLTITEPTFLTCTEQIIYNINWQASHSAVVIGGETFFEHVDHLPTSTPTGTGLRLEGDSDRRGMVGNDTTPAGEVTFTAATDDLLTATSPTSCAVSVGDQIEITTVGGGGTPLAAQTYWVVDVPTVSTFKISTTEGGAPVDITEATSGTWKYTYTPVIFVEGWWFHGRDLGEGINPGSMPDFIWIIQNCRIEQVTSRSQDEYDGTGDYVGAGCHPDILQLWAGVKELRVDGVTGYSNSQGWFDGETGGAVVRGPRYLRRLNFEGVDYTTPVDLGGDGLERSTLRFFRAHKQSLCGNLRVDQGTVWAKASPNSSNAAFYCGDDSTCNATNTTRFGNSATDNLGTYRTFEDVYITDPAVTFTAGTDDVWTANGHGLSVNDVLTIDEATSGGTPMAKYDVVHVVEVLTANTFKVSATAGGDPIDITVATSGTWEYCKHRGPLWAGTWDDDQTPVRLYEGSPPGGDYVPAGGINCGLGYVSPGYL